jgi:hypothetical protein
VRSACAVGLGLVLALSAPLAAQVPAAEPGSELTVTLITYETGERIWERFGHNALWIHNQVTGEDEHYDYGRFSFEKPHFLLRFIQGRMWYSMGFETNVQGMVEAYARQGRRIWAQELALSPAQRAALQQFLHWNWQPEHREYFYDYYRDNCSTRIRDAIDRVIGGVLQRYGAQPSGMTWRDETRRLNENNASLNTGMLLVLGQPVDAEMTRWEQMFLPMRLRQHLDSIQIAGTDGSLHPLVRNERLLNPGGRWEVPDRPTSWLLGYLLLGLVAGGGLVLLGRTRAFLPLATLWTLLTGLAGAFMTYLWTGSHHLAAYRNENLLLCTLPALVLAFVLPSALRGRRWAIEPARRLALLIVLLGGLALLLKVLPWFRQHNLEMIALFLPLNLGLWLGLERGLRVRASAPS